MSNNTINWKGECRYGEECYRVNPSHLKEYQHPHLEKILKKTKNNANYKIPENLFVANDIIVKQLDLIKPIIYPDGFKNEKNDESVSVTDVKIKKDKNVTNSPSVVDSPNNPIKKIRLTLPLSKKDDSPRQQVHLPRPVASLSPVLKHKTPEKLKLSPPKTSKMTEYLTPSRKRDANSPRNLMESTKHSNITNTPITSSNRKNVSSKISPVKPIPSPVASTSTSPSKPSSSKPPPNQIRNFPKIEDVFKVVAPKGLMAKKLEKAAPYNFFLTAISDSKPTHSEPLSVTFQELLDPSLGDLDSSIQINFMVDVGFLMAQYIFSGNENKPMVILYGQDSDDMKKIPTKYPEITPIKIEMSAFATHHSKMMILCYTDNSVRVVVSTANLYEDDWHNRTQGLWISPKCPELPEGSDTTAGESKTGFKESILRYLIEYKIPKLQRYIVKIRKCDFSSVNVFLVASSPGGHRTTPKGPLWGHPRLGYILEKHCAPIEDYWPVVTQSSSIGTLGANVNDWISNEFVNSLRKDSTPLGLRRIPEFKLIYPTFNNVVNGHDGILSGGCLPYSKKVNDKQPWLKNHLYQWKCKTRHRNAAMPHIKTYCRWTDDKLGWFCLTSANLSKAAWGAYNKTGNFERPLRINNWEAGVLFLPKFVIGKDYFSRREFPMPYDVPLVKYGIDDVPFVSDLLFD